MPAKTPVSYSAAFWLSFLFSHLLQCIYLFTYFFFAAPFSLLQKQVGMDLSGKELSQADLMLLLRKTKGQGREGEYNPLLDAVILLGKMSISGAHKPILRSRVEVTN